MQIGGLRLKVSGTQRNQENFFVQVPFGLALIELRSSAGHGEMAANSAQELPASMKGGARAASAEQLTV